MKWGRRIGVALAVLLFAALVYCVAFPTYLGPTRPGNALLGAKRVLQACEAYHDNPDNTGKRYPTALADLVPPPFGGGAFLRDGDRDLIDPWGHPYRYAVITNANGE